MASAKYCAVKFEVPGVSDNFFGGDHKATACSVHHSSPLDVCPLTASLPCTPAYPLAHLARFMVNYYDELEIEDFVWDPKARVYHYPCPCGDRFEITKGQLRDGEEIATCPSCSLIVRVIYDYVSGRGGRAGAACPVKRGRGTG